MVIQCHEYLRHTAAVKIAYKITHSISLQVKLFICHIHNYTEYIEIYTFILNLCSAFNPSKCTYTWSSGQLTLRRPASPGIFNHKKSLVNGNPVTCTTVIYTYMQTLNSYSLQHVSVTLALPTLTSLRGPTGFSTSTSDVSEQDVAAPPASSTAVTRLLLPLASSTTSRWTWMVSPLVARDTEEGLWYHRDLLPSNVAWLQPQLLHPPAVENATL